MFGEPVDCCVSFNNISISLCVFASTVERAMQLIISLTCDNIYRNCVKFTYALLTSWYVTNLKIFLAGLKNKSLNSFRRNLWNQLLLTLLYKLINPIFNSFTTYWKWTKFNLKKIIYHNLFLISLVTYVTLSLLLKLRYLSYFSRKK